MKFGSLHGNWPGEGSLLNLATIATDVYIILRYTSANSQSYKLYGLYWGDSCASAKFTFQLCDKHE